ncbi:vegetative cell wall protein gp1-like [Cephus cinctus]|uniref:Vegetative cell wall protein gp1-like n=1 Tax=Cephus cinctus TaxID=211228 RepID=A0AAJ7FCY7_CEPCN|nr:vegetative cell wall protein gp1-like [Cephus cinctus]
MTRRNTPTASRPKKNKTPPQNPPASAVRSVPVPENPTSTAAIETHPSVPNPPAHFSVPNSPAYLPYGYPSYCPMIPPYGYPFPPYPYPVSPYSGIPSPASEPCTAAPARPDY